MVENCCASCSEGLLPYCFCVWDKLAEVLPSFRTAVDLYVSRLSVRDTVVVDTCVYCVLNQDYLTRQLVRGSALIGPIFPRVATQLAWPAAMHCTP